MKCDFYIFESCYLKRSSVKKEINYIETDTYMARVDTEFPFECSTRCLTGERSEHVKYKVEHSKRNSIISTHALTSLWDKSNYDENFPTIKFLTDSKLQVEGSVCSLCNTRFMFRFKL